MDLFIIGVAAWLVLSILVAVAANTRGRNPIGWFLISLLAAPTVGVLYPLGWQLFGFSMGLSVPEIERALYGFLGWLVLCAVASPVIAGAFLLALPRLNQVASR